MSVIIETTLGDITVDLYLEKRPVTCLNFLKLCKIKYYNFNLFHSIRSGFIAQTGDPTGEGSGGQSIFGVLEGPEKRFFSGEKMPKIRHTDTGLLSMVCTGDMMVGSQFFFTLAPDLDSLDGVHCVIGEVTEGHDVLRKLNDVICDDTHRPYRDVRITHTVILEDPFNDPTGLRAPSRSPSPSAERLRGGRIAPDEEIDDTQGKSAAEVHEIIEEKEAKARATILEIIGDLPDADIAPPENVLFVCKLNPVTTDEDLEIIFSRFGKIVTCEVIRDKKTGDSLQYAFIEFSDKKSCEDAYFKMDNVLIDDRRIHVDFSQSVSKIKWLGKGRGVKHISDEEIRKSNSNNDNWNQSRKKDHRNGRDYDKNRHNYNDDKKYDDRRHIQQDRKDKDRHKRREKSPSDRSSSRSKREKNLNNTEDNYHLQESSHRYEKHDNNRRYSSREEDTRTKRHESNRPTKQSPKRDKSYESKYKNEKSENFSIENSLRNKERKEKDHQNNTHRSIKEGQDYRIIRDSRNKRSHKEYESHKSNQHSTEPKTPSPIKEKREKHLKKSEKKKHRISKKKRKPSTSSSESETSDSSSSSSASSSDRNKNKVLRRRKRKRSSSSSSSSSESSTSSSSSSSSSSSTSSDSDANKRKRRKKIAIKKQVIKIKRKL